METAKRLDITGKTDALKMKLWNLLQAIFLNKSGAKN